MSPLKARMQIAYRLCKSAYRVGAKVVGAQSDGAKDLNREGPGVGRPSWPIINFFECEQ
jgi:hypothetical protein